MPEADLISLFGLPLEQAGLSYMVTGATAAILHGQPRTTNHHARPKAGTG